VARAGGCTGADRLHGDPTAVQVEIADEGKGFEVDGASGVARRGLRESVHGRMSRIGGTAAITSADNGP
jgi:signal transduction histidine kinase